MIYFQDSLSRNKVPFVPQDQTNVTLYACGITPYSTPHIGNARPAIIFDVLFRLLRHTYGDDSVVYTRNITDVDDKIIARAKENGESISDLTNRTIEEYHEAMWQLNVKPPTEEPRVTQYIDRIIDQIIEIIGNGHAYYTNGHILFDIASFPDHGKLSGHQQENLQSGHRILAHEDINGKKSLGDFVLWKPVPNNQPGWMSPWGYGRMGWHIECSSMIAKIYGKKTIDIHGGGADLRFPHHDCEISQFSAANKKPLANYWLHNAMITVDGQKMSKSLGNIITVEQMLDKYNGQVIRLALLSTHYQSPLDWTNSLLENAKQTLTGWHRALLDIEGLAIPVREETHSVAILEPLNSDLNVPLAIAKLHEKIGDMRATSDITVKKEIAAGIRYAASILGINLSDNYGYLKGGILGPQIYKIHQLMADRKAARENKNWKQADSIRKELIDLGISVEDTSSGSVWWKS
jgi:cysteinyl-tRNA synthetase